jgi:hypothetical protein
MTKRTGCGRLTVAEASGPRSDNRVEQWLYLFPVEVEGYSDRSRSTHCSFLSPHGPGWQHRWPYWRNQKRLSLSDPCNAYLSCAGAVKLDLSALALHPETNPHTHDHLKTTVVCRFDGIDSWSPVAQTAERGRCWCLTDTAFQDLRPSLPSAVFIQPHFAAVHTIGGFSLPVDRSSNKLHLLPRP